MNRKLRFLATICAAMLLTLLIGRPLRAQDAADSAAPATKHFLIILRPVPRLHTEAAWTDSDNTATYAHFKRLKEAAAEGRVVLAGKTDEPLDRTLGLVILAATDEAEARAFMESDPCVTAGVMTAELRPYGLAIRGKWGRGDGGNKVRLRGGTPCPL